MPIHFFSEDVPFSLRNRRVIRAWVMACMANEGCEIGDVNCIFCSDGFLLDMNNVHLDHDYFTDIITFDYSQPPLLSGDLFISIDRVRDNARSLKTSVNDELHRVIIHGVLHLAGYSDKSAKEQANMRAKEDSCLTLRPF